MPWENSTPVEFPNYDILNAGVHIGQIMNVRMGRP